MQQTATASVVSSLAGVGLATTAVAVFVGPGAVFAVFAAATAFFTTGPPRFSFLCDARAAANILSTPPDLREL